MQLPLLDWQQDHPARSGPGSEPGWKMIFSKLRQLHDELNAQLYSQPAERPIISSPADAANLIIPFIGIWIMKTLGDFIGYRNRVLRLVKLYQGSINSSQVRIAEVFREAILKMHLRSFCLICHPSGDRHRLLTISPWRGGRSGGEIVGCGCIGSHDYRAGKVGVIERKGAGLLLKIYHLHIDIFSGKPMGEISWTKPFPILKNPRKEQKWVEQFCL